MTEKREKNIILVLIDWENLLINMDVRLPESFSLSSGLNKLMKWLESIGDVFGVFVFAPPHAVQGYLEIFHKYKFYTILCPKISRGTIDTTDETLINFGEQMIAQMRNLSHFCIVSGDRDFSLLIKSAKKQKLKIAIAAGDLKSLSEELIDLANRHPSTNERMVHIFSPIDNSSL